jgi:hypothetical protein
LFHVIPILIDSIDTLTPGMMAKGAVQDAHSKTMAILAGMDTIGIIITGSCGISMVNECVMTLYHISQKLAN